MQMLSFGFCETAAAATTGATAAAATAAATTVKEGKANPASGSNISLSCPAVEQKQKQGTNRGGNGQD